MPLNLCPELEQDQYYKFSLEGKEESRYIRLVEGREVEVFKEDEEQIDYIPETSIIGNKCDPNSNLLLKTFTLSELSDEEFLKFNSPSDDWTSEETWLVMEACFCFTWTILLFLIEQWTNILESKTRSVEINRGTYSRKFGKIPRRYIS